MAASTQRGTRSLICASWFSSSTAPDLFPSYRFFSEETCREKKKPATVELSYLKLDMPMSSLQLRPAPLRAASGMGWLAMWKGFSVPRADFLLWAKQPRQLITECTQQLQELIWPWMQLWPPSVGRCLSQLWFFLPFSFLFAVCVQTYMTVCWYMSWVSRCRNMHVCFLVTCVHACICMFMAVLLPACVSMCLWRYIDHRVISSFNIPAYVGNTEAV